MYMHILHLFTSWQNIYLQPKLSVCISFTFFWTTMKIMPSIWITEVWCCCTNHSSHISLMHLNPHVIEVLPYCNIMLKAQHTKEKCIPIRWECSNKIMLWQSQWVNHKLLGWSEVMYNIKINNKYKKKRNVERNTSS